MTLAPSAHNTQPWRFTVRDGAIDVLVAEERHLAVSDPTRRQLYVSLGCAIENGVIAAAASGTEAVVRMFPKGDVAARLMLKPGSATDSAGLAAAIKRRRTDRRLYDAKPLTADETAALAGVSDDNVVVVTDRAAIEQLAEQTKVGTTQTLSRRDFKEELSGWVRNSWTRQPDGMPGYAMGMPALLSLVAAPMVKLMPIHKQEGPKAYTEMASSSAVVVIASRSDTREDWLLAGCSLERVWLAATAAGLAAAPLASAIEAGETTRESVRSVIGGQRWPQALLRVGHSSGPAPRATPRRRVADCLIVGDE